MLYSSDELIKIAKQHERHDALVGDALDPPHPANRFDFAISIAVLHHLSTRERRVDGVRATLTLLRPSTHHKGPSREQKWPDEDNNSGGQALFFVWALEQKGSRRGWDEGGEQDVLVPWVLKPSSESSRQGKPENRAKKGGKRKARGGSEDQGDKEHTISDDSAGTGGVKNEPNHDIQDKASSEEQAEQQNEEKPPQVYQRYYHLYHQGELEEDIISAGGEIVKNGYDRDNWWCIAKRRAE